MNEMLVRSRALRVAGFGLTLMAGATLSACGGDNNNDGGGGGGGGGSVGTADLTAAGAKAQVGTFGQMIQALGALDSLNNTAPIAAAPRNKPLGKRSTVRSKASEACPDGGTIESTGPTSKNVGSPFTDMSMSVSGTQTTDCKYSDSYSSDGSDVTIDLVSNGATEGGGVEDNNTWVEYARVGSDSAPYSFDYDIDSSGNAQGVSYSSKVKLGIGIDYRDDYKENSDGAEDRFVLSMDGDYDATASSNGQGGSTSGNFTYYIGTHDTPFTAVEDNAGTVISGGPCDTIRFTVLNLRAWLPPVGVWLITEPAGTDSE